ncbi:type II secretion system protein N, partial [Burkholderia mallei]
VLGVTIANPQSLSFAILANNGRVKSYKIGETLDDTAYQLTEVYRDHIVLSQNGQTSNVAFGSAFSLDQRDATKVLNPNGAILSDNLLT